MALVVESTATQSGTNQTSLVQTAPTGIEVGNLLVWVLMGHIPPQPTGWTTITTNNSNVRALYKIADSSDAAASNFTATFGTEDGAASVMLRVSGWSSGNPVYGSNTTDSTYGSTPPATLGGSSLTLERPNQQLLIMVNAGVTDDDGAWSVLFSGHTITSGDSNPTWTEVFDTDNIEFDSGNRNGYLNVAYATSTDTSQITAYAATLTEGGFSGLMDYSAELFVLVAPTSATANISRLDITPSLRPLTGSNTATANISRLDAEPEFRSVTGKSTSDRTRWNNPTKENTDWNNPTL